MSGHNPSDDHGLNPALAATRFCPRCGTAEPRVAYPRSLHCDACGHQSYFNPKPVAATILREGSGDAPGAPIWLLRRGFDPGAGLWTFPGGFVDLGESVEDAARREAREEVGVEVDIVGLIGVYSRPEDRVVLVVFEARPLGTPQTSPEATEVAPFTAATLPWEDLAFWSTTQALRDLVAGRPGG
ncbi:NUDIX domain-containing protein [Baekduia soli]|uniref:NUDIX domain-containing protein n=1 Tax=Baekduia soli TaxID=496014 RepID=A0A5B8UBC1_9ACTN|nr:NUDIX domain-containing protein [Baekduia soli]QEC50456.1 NUDIX domain-containing protein [Baekduia soli]